MMFNVHSGQPRFYRTLASILMTTISLVGLEMSRTPVLVKAVPISSNLTPHHPDTIPYRLGAGDRLKIDILNAPEFSGETVVLSDGTLNLPFVGRFSVQGMTLPEAIEVITTQYTRLLKRPMLNINLIGPRPLNIEVSGEVTRPGFYTLAIPLVAGGGVQLGFDYPTLAQALQSAGGITLMGDLRRVQIRRFTPGQGEAIIEVNVWSFLTEGQTGQNPLLQDGDSIFIPTVEDMNLYETLQLTSTSFARDFTTPRTVAVVGEVYKPGSYVVSGGSTTADSELYRDNKGLPTLTRALQLAGGIKPLANVRQIQIRRIDHSGSVQIIPIDLWLLLQGDISQDTLLQERDTIVVPTLTDEPSIAEKTQLATASFSPANIRVTVVGEVNNRNLGVIEVPANTTLNQALLGAGGFSSRSYRTAVELVRLHPDGTVTNRTVDIDFSAPMNEQTNPLLRNNDIIVVGRSALAIYSDTASLLLSPVDRVFTILRTLEVLGIISDN